MDALKWITAEARRIKQRSPNKHRKWTGFVQEASALYRKGKSGKAPAVRRSKPARAKVSGKRRAVKRQTGGGHSAQVGKVGAGTLKAELKRRIKTRIDRAVISKYHATKKRDKKRHQKTITTAKAELRRLV